jgi:hypothetical protein
LLTALYYGYVAVRFYRREIMGLLRGAKNNQQTSNAQAPAVNSRPAPEQGTMFPVTSSDQASELFKAMEKVIGLLKQMISDGVTSGIGRDDLLDHIRELLAQYRHLRRTQYQIAINNFLVRSCASNFSLPLADEDLAKLWG